MGEKGQLFFTGKLQLINGEGMKEVESHCYATSVIIGTGKIHRLKLIT